MVVQKTLNLRTSGRDRLHITDDVNSMVGQSNISDSICHVFIMHTSTSLMLCENADPIVRADLETIMERLAPDGDPVYRHDTEGVDDMAAYIRTVLTDSNLNLPVKDGRCLFG